MSYSNEERHILKGVAQNAIQFGLEQGMEMRIDLSEYPASLQENRASFVTLHIEGQLRGCIGSLEAYQPLVIDVARNSFAAAFRDPRFMPLRADEFIVLDIHLSILSKPEQISFQSEIDLVKKLRPGIDGLILSDNGMRGTFLPAVWEELKDPQQFLQHLKMKAGLPVDYWSDTITVSRYTTESF